MGECQQQQRNNNIYIDLLLRYINFRNHTKKIMMAMQEDVDATPDTEEGLHHWAQQNDIVAQNTNNRCCHHNL